MRWRNFTTGYGYDAASNRTTFIDSENGSTTYAYDTLNRLQTLAPPSAISSGNFGFGYDALSRRTSLTRPNSVNTSYGYDNLSRLLSVTHAKSGTTLDGATYGLDNAGNRTSKTDLYANLTTNYGYDNLYELLSATQGANTTESYSYDPVGNRLTELGGATWNYNTSNELTARPSYSYTYDANGNTQTMVNSSGTTTYAWDFEDRLASVTLPGSGGTVSYRYDPFGRRIYKSSTSGTSIYAYDAANVVEEANGAGVAVARYSQGLNIDEPLAMLRASTTSYYQADGLGSTTSLSNAAGALAQTYTFDSFGNQTASSGSLTNPFRYSSREFDTETNLYYNRARYYDPQAGRFLSEDPLGFGGDGANFYAYVGNRATGFTDVLGLSMEAARSGLCTISHKKFGPACRKFLEKLANARGMSVDSLISQLQAMASSAQSYVYDGPSSTTPLDQNSFPGASSAGAKTVGDTFDNPGQIALSQFNGASIFVRSGDWGSGIYAGIFSPFAHTDGTATQYGLGVLTHELLHKQSVGGGFSHEDMRNALNAAGAPGANPDRNDIGDRIGILCF